jgi:hypothetical protein
MTNTIIFQQSIRYAAASTAVAKGVVVATAFYYSMQQPFIVTLLHDVFCFPLVYRTVGIALFGVKSEHRFVDAEHYFRVQQSVAVLKYGAAGTGAQGYIAGAINDFVRLAQGEQVGTLDITAEEVGNSPDKPAYYRYSGPFSQKDIGSKECVAVSAVNL